ncbi:MAG: hypothetical protein JW995_01430 [Melioribacteraceae bacterium]|nr:hypothetical protein [Melioribacteraceae bacterium]
MKALKHPVITVVMFVLVYSCGPGEKTVDKGLNESGLPQGVWSENDSRTTASLISDELVTDEWAVNYFNSKKKKPVLSIGRISNKSKYEIDVESLTADIELELVNSGQITFASSKKNREELRENRKNPGDFSTPAELKKYYSKLGVEFLFSGDLTAEEKNFGNEKIITYIINYEVTDIKNSRTVWAGTEEIKKSGG